MCSASRLPGGLSAATALLAATFLLAAPGAFADGDAFADLVRRAVAQSDSIIDAEDALADALEAISPGFDVDLIKWSVSGSGRYTYAAESAPPNTPSGFAPQAGASVSVPIIPQITVGADLSTDFEKVGSSYELLISPLAPGRVTYRERKSYDLAWLAYVKEAASLPYRVEAAIFDLSSAARSREIAEEKLAVAKAQYEIAAAKYEIGDLGWADYDAKVGALASAERSVYSEEQSELDRRNKLVDLIGVSLGDGEVSAPTFEELVSLIESRRNAVESGADLAASTALLQTRIELSSLERQLSETRLFDPSLSIRANADIPFSSVGVTASFSLSNSQIHRDERDELAEAIAKQRLAVSSAERSFEFERKILERQIASAQRLYATAESSVESARIAREVTAYYHAIGERTDIELEESRLSLLSAELSRYRNGVSLYSAYGDYLELIEIGAMYQTGR